MGNCILFRYEVNRKDNGDLYVRVLGISEERLVPMMKDDEIAERISNGYPIKKVESDIRIRNVNRASEIASGIVIDNLTDEIIQKGYVGNIQDFYNLKDDREEYWWDTDFKLTGWISTGDNPTPPIPGMILYKYKVYGDTYSSDTIIQVSGSDRHCSIPYGIDEDKILKAIEKSNLLSAYIIEEIAKKEDMIKGYIGDLTNNEFPNRGWTLSKEEI